MLSLPVLGRGRVIPCPTSPLCRPQLPVVTRDFDSVETLRRCLGDEEEGRARQLVTCSGPRPLSHMEGL